MQNWYVLQDKRGIIYVGNQGGLLEYDGFSWRFIDVPNKTVRSIAMDETGTIYIGGKDEIGHLTPDKNGTLKYASLRQHLKENHKNFGTVWNTYALADGIYFDTSKYLFRWNLKKVDVWEPGTGLSFNSSFNCEGRLFIHQRKAGLKRIVNNSIEMIPGGEAFASAKVYMVAPFESQKLLLGTRSKGFFIYDGLSAVPFPTEADEYLKKNQLYYGIRLSSGDFALATRLGGLVLIDSNGKLKDIFNTSYGLPDNSVKYIFEDFQGNLWLCLNDGITKIEYVSPFHFYDSRSGLTGIVLSVVKHKNLLYSGSYNGLYSIGLNGRFQQVAGISSTCWSILPFGESLLTATTHGVFQVERRNNIFFKRKINDRSVYVISHSKQNTNRVWGGEKEGLISLYYEEGKNQWREEHKFINIKKTIRSILEDQNGNLWLGLSTKGVIKVDFKNKGKIINPIIKEFDKADGLPDVAVRVFLISDRVIFASENGLYRFDERKQAFYPDFILGERFAGGEKGSPVFRMTEDSDGNIWFHSNQKNLMAPRKKDGSYTIEDKPFLRLPPGQANTIYPDPDGNSIWYACNEGLIRYYKSVKKNYDLDFCSVVRKVWVNRKLIYDGYKYKKDNDSSAIIPLIAFNNRKNFQFEFAAPFFEAEDEIEYSYFLEGLDDLWSNWNKENTKEFTILDSGMYTFRVRAKNVYGNISREDTYRFRILPPWYQTWWAIVLYALAGLFVMFLLVRWRSGKLAREKKRLEKVVKERTKEIEARTQEINEKNLQLQEQTEQLTEQSEKLKDMDQVKSRFFANISHEFRTPLTLIMGPLEQMIATCPEDDEDKKLKYTMMLRNAQRLLRLINQLLELSKLDSGKMQLRAVKTGILTFVKGIIDSFRVLTRQKEMELVFQSAQEDIEEEIEGDIFVYIDPRKMEDVLSNLLVNAVKFTPPGGEVKVTVKSSPKNKQENMQFPEGYIEIVVFDTGPGIPEEQLAHVFDRFYQVDSTYEYHQKGSGIGLALSKELVELHRGTIEAANRETGGSEFIVRLPFGQAHLTDDEIVDIDVSNPQGGSFEKPPPYPPRKTFDDFEDTDTIANVVHRDGPEGLPEKFLVPPFYKKVDRRRQEQDIILVVEDSKDMRGYIRGALEPDYIVEEAGDGREGIEKARQMIPDLIISDIMMPEVDGYELCRTLKNDKSTSHVPVVLLTAKAAEENIVEGLETGADDYITKPFSTKILLARIKNLIDIRSQLQQNINREMTLQPVKTAVSEIDREFLREVHATINENIADEEFNVEQLCKKLYMGRTTLYRKIQALSGLTPTEFIRSYRLKRGAELLKQNFGTVLEVAMEVGFANSSYFAKCFKEKFHRLPSEYQAANKE